MIRGTLTEREPVHVGREFVLPYYDGRETAPGNHREDRRTRCTREPADAIRLTWNCPT